mgnify:CR=1 FL=1
MKATNKFAEQFWKYLYEDISVGSALGGSPNGFSPTNINSSDFYAPGDARIPKGGKTIQTRQGAIKIRNKKKKRKRFKRTKL